VRLSAIIRGLPQRTKTYTNIRIDSTRWDHYVPRQGDIVVATYAKNGTTWMEHIVLNLIHRNPEKPTIHEVAVWVDRRKRRDTEDQEDYPVAEMVEKLQQQKHHRQMKTHLPLDHLPFHTEVKYVIVGRPNRDVWLSWHNHYRNWLERGDLPEDPKDFWADWIEGKVAPQSDWSEGAAGIHPHFQYYQQWWSYRHLDNILFVHFNDLLSDLPTEVSRITEFLEIEASPTVIQDVAQATTFTNMKTNADQLLPGTKRPDLFLNKGTNNRWRAILTDADLLLYNEARRRAVSMGVDDACLTWLERTPPG
jgi:aryl sulfotransferase